MRRSKLIYFCLVMVLVLSMGVSAFAEEKTMKMVIPELCASNFSDAADIFESFKNISNFELDVENTLATVTYNTEGLDIEALIKALEGLEMPVKSIEPVN